MRDGEVTARADRELELVEQHLGLAEMIGHKASANGYADPAQDVDDAIQDAAVGMLQAAKSFDEDRGFTFATHAVHRMRGQVQDARRNLDPVPRSVRQLERDHRDVIHTLRQELGRTPTLAEVRRRLGATTAKEADLLMVAPPISIDEVRRRDDGSLGWPIYELIPDERAEGEFHEGELGEALEPLLAELPERQRFVVSLYYFENLTLREIGDVLGVTESRASQLHTKALRRLRTLCDKAGITAEAA